MNKEILGKEYEPFEFPIEKGKIRELAAAAYDDNPIYFDEEYAKKTKFGGIIAPPNFATIARFYNHSLQIREDLARKPGHTGHAEEEYIYFKPILAGDVLTGRQKVVDFYERTGRRGGKITFAVTETTFYNQKQEKVLVARNTMMETSTIVPQ